MSLWIRLCNHTYIHTYMWHLYMCQCVDSTYPRVMCHGIRRKFVLFLDLRDVHLCSAGLCLFTGLN